MNHLNFATQLTYGILSLATISLWLPQTTPFNRRLWLILLFIAAVSGLYFKILQPIALLWLVLFGTSAWALTRRDLSLAARSLSLLTVLALSTGLLMHYLPGFSNPKVISKWRFSRDALPYTKYLNFDSALIGLFILGFGHQRLSGAAQWRRMLKSMAPVALLTMATIMCLSLALGYVRWQPKWTSLFWLWAGGNLIYTCVIEEAFFRGFIQKRLMQGFAKTAYGDARAISIAAVLFGLRHYAGGIEYVGLAIVAGIGYGWVYRRTRHIEASILTHFGLNTLHLLLFSYPALARSL